MFEHFSSDQCHETFNLIGTWQFKIHQIFEKLSYFKPTCMYNVQRVTKWNYVEKINILVSFQEGSHHKYYGKNILPYLYNIFIIITMTAVDRRGEAAERATK